ncbi:hypothetical protein C2U27_19035 [Bacillus aerophilus]|nr:hypothetical protein [Bacillus aerophilus]
MSVLRAGAHECEIRSAPVIVLPRLQRFSITLKRRQRAKIWNSCGYTGVFSSEMKAIYSHVNVIYPQLLENSF